MATLVAVNPRLVQGDQEIVSRHAATSTAWKAGEFLRVNSSGELVAISDNAGLVGIQYQAISDRATGDAAGYVEVAVVTSAQVYEMHFKSGAAVAAQEGQGFDISVDSNVQTLDPADTTGPSMTVLSLCFNTNPAQNDSADTVARVWARVLQTAIDAAPAA
jgi:hypothetical protein